MMVIFLLFQNMWDLTPDTDLLKELPQTYSFETAFADLILSFSIIILVIVNIYNYKFMCL